MKFPLHTAGNVVSGNQADLQLKALLLLDFQKKGDAILNSYFHTRQNKLGKQTTDFKFNLCEIWYLHISDPGKNK